MSHVDDSACGCSVCALKVLRKSKWPWNIVEPDDLDPTSEEIGIKINSEHLNANEAIRNSIRNAYDADDLKKAWHSDEFQSILASKLCSLQEASEMLKKLNETFTIFLSQCAIEVVKKEILRILNYTTGVIACLTSSIRTVMLSEIPPRFRTVILSFARHRFQVNIVKTRIRGLISYCKKEEEAALKCWKMTKDPYFDNFMSTVKSFPVETHDFEERAKQIDELIDGKRSCSKWKQFWEQLLYQLQEFDNDKICENVSLEELKRLLQSLSESMLSIEKIDQETMKKTRIKISKVLDDDKRSLKELRPLFTRDEDKFIVGKISDILLLNQKNETNTKTALKSSEIIQDFYLKFKCTDEKKKEIVKSFLQKIEENTFEKEKHLFREDFDNLSQENFMIATFYFQRIDEDEPFSTIFDTLEQISASLQVDGAHENTPSLFNKLSVSFLLVKPLKLVEPKTTIKRLSEIFALIASSQLPLTPEVKQTLLCFINQAREALQKTKKLNDLSKFTLETFSEEDILPKAEACLLLKRIQEIFATLDNGNSGHHQEWSKVKEFLEILTFAVLQPEKTEKNKLNRKIHSRFSDYVKFVNDARKFIEIWESFENRVKQLVFGNATSGDSTTPWPLQYEDIKNLFNEAFYNIMVVKLEERKMEGVDTIIKDYKKRDYHYTKGTLYLLEFNRLTLTKSVSHLKEETEFVDCFKHFTDFDNSIKWKCDEWASLVEKFLVEIDTKARTIESESENRDVMSNQYRLGTGSESEPLLREKKTMKIILVGEIRDILQTLFQETILKFNLENLLTNVKILAEKIGETQADTHFLEMYFSEKESHHSKYFNEVMTIMSSDVVWKDAAEFRADILRVCQLEDKHEARCRLQSYWLGVKKMIEDFIKSRTSTKTEEVQNFTMSVEDYCKFQKAMFEKLQDDLKSSACDEFNYGKCNPMKVISQIRSLRNRRCMKSNFSRKTCNYLGAVVGIIIFLILFGWSNVTNLWSFFNERRLTRTLFSRSD